MDYKYKLIYPNAYELLPTDDPEFFVGVRERDGAIQRIKVQVIESAPFIEGNVENVTMKVITTILGGDNDL